LEKNRVGSKMISGPTETPSDWMTTSIPVSARLHGGHLEGVAGHFFQLGVVDANSPG